MNYSEFTNVCSLNQIIDLPLKKDVFPWINVEESLKELDEIKISGKYIEINKICIF